MMKRILQIDNYMYPHIGGIEQVTRDVLNALKDEYEMRILCFNHGKGTITDKVDGVDVTRVNCQVKVASQSIALSYGKVLKKIMKEYKPEIVIFHYPNPFVAHFLKRYLKKRDFKFIVWWHLDITKQKILGKLFKGQTKKLLKYADKVVATSPNYIEGSPFLKENENKCIVIPNCVSQERLKYDETHIAKAKEIKEKYNGKTILFGFGRHVEYKGITYLVKASKKLDDSYAVLIGGKGPLTEGLKEEAKDDNKVEFLGRISDDDLKAYLLACDIFCFPSITKNEAFGIGLAEAMYYGKAVITFNIPGSGVNYVSIKDETGLEVENQNVEAYAEAIKKLSNDNELRLKFEKNSKDRVNELFLDSRFNTLVNELISEVTK
ncbi:MAG: glycosyltransferase [Acholeplasmatales bacterium]|nr:glycosyltransferase [Acholeplasmatales bacterium]